MDLSKSIRQFEFRLGMVIDVEILHPAFVEAESLALAPDQYLHHSDFCRQCKRSPGGLTLCARNKERSKQIAAYGKNFFGCCPHGVWDYAFPVKFEDRLACILYLGMELPRKTPPVPLAEIRRAAHWLADYILLELELWREGRGRRRKHDEFYYQEQCIHYIERTYNRAPALSELAEILHVNANYLGSAVQRASGKSFRTLLTERRLKEAVLYLELHRAKMSISEIGRFCGFADSNYFSTVFRRAFGVSPKQYAQNLENNQRKA